MPQTTHIIRQTLSLTVQFVTLNNGTFVMYVQLVLPQLPTLFLSSLLFSSLLLSLPVPVTLLHLTRF